MRLARAEIRNFRSLKNVAVDFGPITAFIGGNGAGKSSVLKAVEKFYSTTRILEADDYYGRDRSVPVEIELTYDNLSDIEVEAFGARVRHRKLTVTRIFDTSPSSGRYHGVVPQHAAFKDIREGSSFGGKRTAYNNLRATGGDYAQLPTIGSVAALEQALETWETQNPGQLELMRDDGQFFGFQNASRGALQQFTSFVFIPAVRDALTDAADTKSSPIAQLLELIVRSALLRREDLQKFRAEMNARYQELTAPQNMPELGLLADQLTSGLRQLYENSAVELAWRATAEMSVPLPAADVSLSHDGFGGPVDRQGHGLQRAFIFTLLQELARATRQVAIDAEEVDEAGAQPDPNARARRVAPSLVLAIEEPELYQHPTKQRHLAAVLRRLSLGTLPGVDGATQVIFASHSPMFVSMPHVGDIRFVRRADCEEGDFRQCELKALDLDAVARSLERAARKRAGEFTADSLRARLHVLGSELAEGFFAEGVVLVEGRSDKAALVAVADRMRVSFESAGIAVLSAEGKSCIDRPLLIFQALGIPTYPVWDCDCNKAERDAKPEQNLLLLRAVDATQDHVDPPMETRVMESYTCFEHNLEATLRAEIGPEIYDECMDAVCAEYGALRSDAQKNPELMKQLMSLVYERGCAAPTIEGIIRSAWRKLKSMELQPEPVQN